MLRISEISLPIDHNDKDLKNKILKRLGIDEKDLLQIKIRKRSVDARKRSSIVFIYTIDCEVRNEALIFKKPSPSKDVFLAPDLSYSFACQKMICFKGMRPLIVGAGPCGLFAGHILAQMGFRPILLDRGKTVEERVMDVHSFWREGRLSPQSNVQFGEGGAGTFSDGKLTTQIKDPDNRCKKVLEELVSAGAPEDILYCNKPHIGTDRLIKVVRNLRRAICTLGGEVRFNSHVIDLQITNNKINGVVLADGDTITSDIVVLAIGHSARDTFDMLYRRGVHLTAKPFSIGLRIEHPQDLINRSQHGEFAAHARLGAADYKLVQHCANKRSVYTFCMCPGGRVISASSEEGGVVINGMSVRARNGENSNSALLVGVKPADFENSGPLAGVTFQRRWEKAAYEIGGRNYMAPVQRVEDFLAGKSSSGDPYSSPVEPTYKPGVVFSNLDLCLPTYASTALKEAISAFDHKIEGFAMPDAILTGVETRSSSPVRILRDDKFESVSVEGLYPAGEGSGYAGGIISSAVDGIKIAETIALKSTSD